MNDLISPKSPVLEGKIIFARTPELIECTRIPSENFRIHMYILGYDWVPLGKFLALPG